MIARYDKDWIQIKTTGDVTAFIQIASIVAVEEAMAMLAIQANPAVGCFILVRGDEDPYAIKEDVEAVMECLCADSVKWN